MAANVAPTHDDGGNDMVTRERYPNGVPCWMELSAPDPQAALDFYGELFGWRYVAGGPGGGYHRAQIDGLDVAGITAAPATAGPPRWLMYVATDDLDAAVARVEAASGRVLDAGGAVPGVGRGAVCSDPAGARFGLWQSLGRVGAQVVNLANTWNFNDLTAPDPDAVAAFYGAVFGWRTAPLAMGDFSATMFCLPGYGDFLASIDPEIRARHAEGSIPPGFSDAVAWLATGDLVPSRWAVTFAVDDTDKVVERAEGLGATVAVAAQDRGVVRDAGLVDPLGAPFTVSHYRG
jgi:predicted enzyme related to lactoylglutathione lyase